MKKLTVISKNRKLSKFLGERRRFFLNKRNSKFGFNFVKINHGTLHVEVTELGTYKALFSSKKTGRKAHAFGKDFHAAYQNLIKMFYLKYTV